MEHFAQKDDKSNKLHKHVHSIRFELTGSELVALLHESHEIKRLQPAINRAQTRKHFPFVMYRSYDEQGVALLDVCRPSASAAASLDVIAEYASLKKAKGALQYIQREYDLCGKYVQLERGKPGAPCFHYHLKSCLGVCAGLEEVASYNSRVDDAVSRIKTVFGEDFFILDQGRNEAEEAVILVENGRYSGFGYRPKPKRRVSNPCQKKLREVIKPRYGNPETARIIRRFLRDSPQLQVVPIDSEQQVTVNVLTGATPFR
jgi:DNA polymerase-3 subunit epsilon